VSCAKAGVAINAASAAPALSKARVEFGRVMIKSPLLRRQVGPGLLPGCAPVEVAIL